MKNEVPWREVVSPGNTGRFTPKQLEEAVRAVKHEEGRGNAPSKTAHPSGGHANPNNGAARPKGSHSPGRK